MVEPILVRCGTTMMEIVSLPTETQETISHHLIVGTSLVKLVNEVPLVVGEVRRLTE